MAHQITSEGGANLSPTSPGQVSAEGGANLAPTAPGQISAEGGADLEPDAPAQFSLEGRSTGALTISGDAEIEIYDPFAGMVPRPIAGAYLPTGTAVNGKQTYTADGVWPPAVEGLAVSVSYDADEGWSILAYWNSDGGLGWVDGEANDLETPDLVSTWEATGTATGSFVLAFSSAPTPPVITAEGGANLAPTAPGSIVPEATW